MRKVSLLVWRPGILFHSPHLSCKNIVGHVERLNVEA